MEKITEYLTIKEAAEFLGISPSTLRNWEKQGKLSAHRNPMNGYRLYRKGELERLLKLIRNSNISLKK
jgi:MerR family transcriptional regulator, copper efflux regulator